jgi:hypothetical protein
MIPEVGLVASVKVTVLETAGLVITLHAVVLPTCVLPFARYVCAVPASVAVKALHTGIGAVPALAGVGFS